MKKWKNAPDLLVYLNETYARLHYAFEKNFWIAAMGDHSVNKKKDVALAARDAFRCNRDVADAVDFYHKKTTGEIKTRLGYWKRFFSSHQVPLQAEKIKQQIDALQTKIETHRARRTEGYVDPKTKKFIPTSRNAMGALMRTNPDEAVRKACFEAVEKLPLAGLGEYITMVGLRNRYARILGYEDFYSYKLAVEEGMTKAELFSLFDEIYHKTQYAFADIRTLEKEKKPNLRKPWNFFYMFSGSFTKEEDPYFPFERAIERWGRSFAALGIDFKRGSLVFDLLDRKGKYNNGFCHWPKNVYYKQGQYLPATAQFTCNVVLGTPGETATGFLTLFHEGGHAAHLLNARMKDICVTTEYPPLSTAWAETQSMFLDTLYSSIEWKMRYAISNEGAPYPFELFERKVRELSVLRPIGAINPVSMVCEFERTVYEEKHLTKTKLISIAKKVMKKYRDYSVDTISILETPHLYSWESACSYHGYGLATLALHQWREHFYKRDGYVVDNPRVGKEMQHVWHYGATKTFPEFVKLATGKKLSASAYIAAVTKSDARVIADAKKKIATLSKKRRYTTVVNLNASITLVDGKKVIADNKKGFKQMTARYASWLTTKYPSL
ncbi:MAG TPA: M3 family metallopeptidase [Candidatus Paceibacterota bacterium]|nr:M3 family metallopeptidase [Candidatus Paceibacterota bacterium]